MTASELVSRSKISRIRPIFEGLFGEVWWVGHARSLGFVGLMLVSVLGYWSSVTELFQLASKDEQYSHILIVLPISFYLLAFETKPRIAPQTSWWAGCSLLICAAAMALWSMRLSASTQLTVAILSLITFWIGSFVLSFGWRTFQALYFPFLFLLLLAPLPGFLMEKIVYLLQSGSAHVAYSLFRLFGIPVGQSGFVFFLPGLNIEIAKECSGIRSSTSLLVTSIALAHLYLKSGWRQALVAASVLPLAIFKNSLRVFILSTLAAYVDPDWLDGGLHRNGGVLFFALALAVVIVFIVMLRRTERRTEKRRQNRCWCSPRERMTSIGHSTCTTIPPSTVNR